MAKKPKVIVTCWQCKKAFKGEEACVSHAKAKKHQWKLDPPIPVLPPSSFPLGSTSTVVTISKPTAAGGVSSTSVTSTVMYCPVCFQLLGTWDALTMHYSVFHTDPYSTRPTLHPCSVCQEFVLDKEQHYAESPKHPNCTACGVGFVDAEALQRHSAERDTCDVCNAHLLPSVTMDDHYGMSPMHPTCKICWTSFRGQEEYLLHCGGCPPSTIALEEKTVDVNPPPDAGSPSVSQDSGLASIVHADSNGDGEVDNETDADTDGVFWEATATRPSASNPEEPEPRENAVSTPTTGDASPPGNESSFTDGVSADDESLARPAYSGVFQPRFARRPLSATSSTAGGTSTSTDSSADQATPSWHCRSCLADPCQDPVTTLCGHIFCKGCIIVALSTRMACPVCEKTYLISLDVGRG